MRWRPLSVPGAWEVSPLLHRDERGVFLEWFTDASFTSHVGHRLDVRQANCSVSAAGVLRGVHLTSSAAGQAKYVTCLVGAVFDVVVDVRVGSPTFGAWDAVLLDDVDRRAVYLDAGLGHAFLSLADGSVVSYLCSTPYAPEHEREVLAIDPVLGIDWPTTGRDGRPLRPRLSAKDAAAPSLHEAASAGFLPRWSDVG